MDIAMIGNRRHFYAVAFFVIVLASTALVYFPGLKGGFIFDDYPNLEALGDFGAVDDIESFKRFVFGGFSGPLGRPLSLASFLLDDNTWPSNPEWFKETNVKIHLLTGILLCWATLNLLRLYRRNDSEQSIIWIAVIGSSIWMLHPYMVSTTLYVVQRMAQLAALFVFAGIAGYLHGRLLLEAGRVRSGYLWMTVSLGLATVLAVLSKENGILLPLLTLTIEFCLPGRQIKLNVWWKWVFLVAPSLVVIAILAREINFAPDAWPTRLFNQPERLMTECRILWEYLYHLYIPRIEGRGLFQDGYLISKSLTSPISTLIALIALISLIAVAIVLRKRFPLASLGIVFFFVGHLLESTVVGLELYFEHRNYMSAAFLFLPIAVMLVELSKTYRLRVAILSGTTLFLLLGFLTWERAKLWSDVSALQLYWAASTPESPRAQNHIGSALWDAGNHKGAIAHVQSALLLHPDSSFLTVNLLLMKIYDKTATVDDFTQSAKKIQTQAFDAQAIVGVRAIVEEVLANNNRVYIAAALKFLYSVEAHPKSKRVDIFVRLVPYLQGRLYLAMGDYQNAFAQFGRAMDRYAETDAALEMVAQMASAQRPREAVMLLKKAADIFQRQDVKTMRRSRDEYESEFKRLHLLLQADIDSVSDERETHEN
ncbi:MAG TPA: hypothetical protein VGE32_02815 [Cellvibrio sp.]